jgi:hypothetical protein
VVRVSARFAIFRASESERHQLRESHSKLYDRPAKGTPIIETVKVSAAGEKNEGVPGHQVAATFGLPTSVFEDVKIIGEAIRRVLQGLFINPETIQVSAFNKAQGAIKPPRGQNGSNIYLQMEGSSQGL